MKPSECWYKDVCSLAPGECKPSCLRYAEMLNLVKLSNIPKYKWRPEPLFADVDIDVFTRLKDIKSNIKEWVQSGSNLYLYSGGFGNGKTSWALKLMLAYFNQIWYGNSFRCRGVFVSVPELLDRERLRIAGSDDDFERLRQELLKCDLVIWDDISSVRMSDYNRATLFNILDARILSGKSNIFTGNLNAQELYDVVGSRLVSRIWNPSEILEFKGKDWRSVR